MKAIEPCDVLSVPRHDINALVEYIPALRESFDKVIKIRQEQNQAVVHSDAPRAAPAAEDTVQVGR